MVGMTPPAALLAFIGAATVLTITPGLDTALVLRSAAAGGPRRAAYAAAGISLGCLTWGAAVSVGLGALLAASELAYTIVKWAGAAYLLWIGFNLIVHPRNSFDTRQPGRDGEPAIAFLKQGLFTNILNPKVGVFYVTFLPQFVPPGANVALFSFLLATIHVMLSIIWFAGLILATIPMGRILRRSRFVRAMDRLAGAIFLCFGARLAISR
jgi:threonine/homoserine/homoserine lactone efflux protein